MSLRLSIVLCVLVVAPTRAYADDEADARALFEQALEAFADREPARARDLLRRSVDTFPSAPGCINLAIAERRTGDAPSAVRTLERLFDGDCGDASAQERETARGQMQRARAQLATLRVRVNGGTDVSLEVDGAPVGALPSSGVLEVPLGPGDHVVTAISGSERVRREVHADAASTIDIELGFAPDLADGSATLSPDGIAVGPGDDQGIVIAVITGVIIAALIGGGIALGLYLVDEADVPDIRIMTLLEF